MTGTKRPTVCVILMLGLIVTSVAVCANPAGARSRPAAPTRSHDSPPPTVPPSAGYWLTTGYGSSYAFDVPYLGNVDTGCATCINSVSSTPSGKGYWMAGTPDFATPGGNHVNASIWVSWAASMGALRMALAFLPAHRPVPLSVLQPRIWVRWSQRAEAWFRSVASRPSAQCKVNR